MSVLERSDWWTERTCQILWRECRWRAFVYAYVWSEAVLVVSLLIVEFGTEGTVKRHSRNCQTAAFFEFSESVELCRSTTDELHVLGRPAQSAWSLDKLTIYKSLKSISVYRFHAWLLLTLVCALKSFSPVDLCKLTRVYFIVTR